MARRETRGVVVAEFERRREERGESVSSLAVRAGWTRANLSEYLAGKTEVRSDVLERLLVALDLEVGRGIGGQSAKGPKGHRAKAGKR